MHLLSRLWTKIGTFLKEVPNKNKRYLQRVRPLTRKIALIIQHFFSLFFSSRYLLSDFRKSMQDSKVYGEVPGTSLVSTFTSSPRTDLWLFTCHYEFLLSGIFLI